MKEVRCPFCETIFEENCEYVDVEVGYIQCSSNHCENCGAFEQGQYPDNPKWIYKDGWVK